jgi:selenocysteine-specific elongation factor
VRSIEVHGQPAARAEPGRRTALALVGVDKGELSRGAVAVTGDGWTPTERLDAEVELLPTLHSPLVSRTRVRVHLGTAEVLARAVPARPIAPGGRGMVRLVLEGPLSARGGDRFVLRSYSPVATIGGGVVLDPLAPTRPRVGQRKLDRSQAAPVRLAEWVGEAGLAGIATRDLPVRLGIYPHEVTTIIADAGKAVLCSDGILVARGVTGAEAERLGGLVARFHHDHPLEPGYPLESLRAAIGGQAGRAVAKPVADVVLDWGARKRTFEVIGTVARRPGWGPMVDTGASARVLHRLAAARWQIPTVAELEQELSGLPVQALLVHLARSGGVEQVDRERYAAPGVLAGFRTALEASLGELGSATPAQLRDRLALSRKYLIPLLEWADRNGITRRQGDERTLVRLTAPSRGP